MPGLVPPIAFLGICERAAHRRGWDPFSWSHDFLGLKTAADLSIFPASLNGMLFSFATYVQGSELPDLRIDVINDETGEHVFFIDLHSTKVLPLTGADLPQNALEAHPAFDAIIPKGVSAWKPFIIRLDEQPIILWKPGLYRFTATIGGEQSDIGFVQFRYIPEPPLTEERKRALLSNPLAFHHVIFDIGCNKCGKQVPIYIGLNPPDTKVLEQSPQAIWYRSLPTHVRCECGSLEFDASMIRESGHAILSPHYEPDSPFTRLYQGRAIENIHDRFARVLDSAKKEEVVHQFILNNPLILQRFSPVRIFNKAPLLTQFNSDFAILTTDKRLLLIEIEKPATTLMTKNGGTHHQLSHAIDQVEDWFLTLDTHRFATLECIGLKVEEVANIRGVVIAGRDKDYDSENLRKLKTRDRGKIHILTFDDLLRDLLNLIIQVNAL